MYILSTAHIINQNNDMTFVTVLRVHNRFAQFVFTVVFGMGAENRGRKWDFQS